MSNSYDEQGRSIDFSKYPESIKLDLTDNVLTITLNNPDYRNAIRPDMDEALTRIFWDADADPEVRVIVLAGAGKSFCAGGDIVAMQEGVDNINNFVVGIKNGKRFMTAMLDCDKPIVARVHGDAVGLGATLALFCDICVASENARFADPHVKVGLVAGDGGAVIWPMNAGFAAAKYFLMTGDLVGAREAQAMGLIAKVTTEEDLDAEVSRIVDKLNNGALQAISYTKHVLNIGIRQLFASSVDAGFALETVSSRLPDHREATTAFVEKRKPKFRG
ncbi:enoyl-CoA hydratase/isomerase family protein [Novosphingobium cyanobacteriorum]|uniref:Enoyl-CoA hydratase/isomerase family protein n=1 Tax=Novosphingobium cyanobacteriorum TaxID=3024215 RepID=A0ABT6CKY0_9SPHN|nr:enoyl-CoA hydratase/isomerase family protein [Novosphingobium cyanobacteriorum]MDF8334584.1 enoyl-CoA hydratase/isomerase family protein [Novosphingobium cyanobacteriorum]